MEEIPQKKSNGVIVYAILTTIFAFISVIALVVVIYLKPPTNILSEQLSINTNTVSSSSLEKAITNKIVRLEIPYNSKTISIIELEYPEDSNIVSSFSNPSTNEKTKELLLTLNSSVLTVKDYGDSRDNIQSDCLNVNSVTDVEKLGIYYRVLEKTDVDYNYYFIGYKTDFFSVIDSNNKYVEQPTCYEKTFNPGVYNNTTRWKISYKVLKTQSNNTLTTFDGIVLNANVLNRLTMKYKGDYKNSSMYKYYQTGDNNDYFYFVKFWGDPTQLKLDVSQGVPIGNLDQTSTDEDYGDTYLITKDMVNSSDLSNLSNIGKEFVIEGKADTVSEGMPSTYKYYSINKIEKK